MRVVVDRDLCQGHGVCESEAPAVFAVDKQGILEVLDPSPPEAERARVEAAVSFCPTHALSIQED
ncbi:MAG TPA: ferredoxin [Acidimicrobiales bacterium]|nr:ferredoxin [Acidimicrobiales bacterium]